MYLKFQILYLLYYKMDTNQMLLLIIALFLIYNMTSICGDGFNVGAEYILNQHCKAFKEDCEYTYYENGSNAYGEPQYNQCQIDTRGYCHSDYDIGDPRLKICTNQCPSCGDLSKYTLSGSNCTKNLETCKQCLNPTKDVMFIGVGMSAETLTDKYSKICPKSGKYTECDDTKSKCTSDLQTILTDTMNSSGQCSIQELYNEIISNGDVALNCNGNNNIYGEEAWLDEALSSVGDGYCKPNNDTWKCNRDDIPSYCKNGQCVLTGNTNNKKCGCPKGTLIDKFGNCTKAVQYCPSDTEKSGYAGTSCFPMTFPVKCDNYYAGDLHSGNNKTNFHMCSGTALCEEEKSKPCAIKP
jgi:hypothetical protein